jgi:hypothetical protein
MCLVGLIWLREYVHPIFVPELELSDSTNTAISASYLELYPEKLTVMMLEKYLLESECVLI